MDATSSGRCLALIGADYWGKNLARNFHALGILWTICEVHPETLANYSTGYDGVERLLHYETSTRVERFMKFRSARPFRGAFARGPSVTGANLLHGRILPF